MEVKTPSNKQLAMEILSQLGGRHFLVMTGTKNLVYDHNSLTMRLTRNNLRAKWLKITLNGLDLYDLSFMTENKDRTAIIKIKDIPNIFAEDIRGLFEQETGLYTSLTHQYK